MVLVIAKNDDKDWFQIGYAAFFHLRKAIGQKLGYDYDYSDIDNCICQTMKIKKSLGGRETKFSDLFAGIGSFRSGLTDCDRVEVTDDEQ